MHQLHMQNMWVGSDSRDQPTVTQLCDTPEPAKRTNKQAVSWVHLIQRTLQIAQ
jgi:hypothetical protein